MEDPMSVSLEKVAHVRPRGAVAQRVMRVMAFVALLWSLCGLIFLFWTTKSQPRKFMPLVMRESDSETSRLQAVQAWQTQTIPSNSLSILGVRSPLADTNLDADLNNRPSSNWALAVDPRKSKSFKQRLFDLNVSVERFCSEYWLQVQHSLEFMAGTALASVLCLIFPRILPSSILLAVAGFAAFIQLDRSDAPTIQSLLWILPVFFVSIVTLGVAIYRWWVAPASAETVNNWNKFWLGLLLTGIGVAAFVALVIWGGRVRNSGLSGLGLCIGWGVYLVSVHGWKLIRSLFSKPHTSIQGDSMNTGQAG